MMSLIQGSATIGDRIRAARKVSRMTQGQLAQRLGLSTPTIVGYEARRTIPRLDVIEAIACILGVSVHYLAGLTKGSLP